MPYNASEKRSRLVEAIESLTYQQGFTSTTLAQVAEQANVPVGNVYYYFKTREDMGSALIDRRQTVIRAALASLDELPDPMERLIGFIRMSVDNSVNLARHGCPQGSLCAELQKVGGTLSDEVSPLLGEPLSWLNQQFLELGKGVESRGLAIHLLASLQGVSLLAQNFRDPSLVSIEAEMLERWLRAA